jgi:hypothetical protein
VWDRRAGNGGPGAPGFVIVRWLPIN